MGMDVIITNFIPNQWMLTFDYVSILCNMNDIMMI